MFTLDFKRLYCMDPAQSRVSDYSSVETNM
jgi:hypothetical protein